ncbi:MAG: VC0807 family protein [Gaiellaceae bacterium]
MVRQAGTPLAPSRVELEQLTDPTWRSMLSRGLPQFAGEAVAPLLVFYVVWKAYGLGPAIAATTVAYLVLAAWIVGRRRDVTLVAVGAVFVVIQAVVALASHSATVYFAQPVVLSMLWGVAYFVSAAIGRPLIGVFAGAWYPFPAWFRASAPFKREFGMQSLVWGGYCLARGALRLYVLLHSGIGGFVVISLLTGTPLFVLLVAWGIWHARRTFTRLDLSMPVD